MEADVGKTLRNGDDRRSPAERYFDRDLSWLEWGRRVLARAADCELPLLERVKFVAIFATSLDEFFQVRVAGLREQLRTRPATRSLDGSTPREQLRRIHARVRELVGLQQQLFATELRKELEEQGIALPARAAPRDPEREGLSPVYGDELLPAPAGSHPDAGSLWRLHRLDRPDLELEPWHPVEPRRLARGPGARSRDSIFQVLSARDVLVHHPYESFGSSVEAFLSEAARDPEVLAIKHTLYRSSGPENPIVRALVQAAQAGKEVVALIELRARFDEGSHIEWARSLVEAGVHVVHGRLGRKAHGKIALVVRREGGQIRRYCHVGTGNYDPQTARHYEDVGLLTGSPEIGADVGQLFNHLTGYGEEGRYRKLLVAPLGMRPALLQLIRSEILSDDGEIALKVNGLSEKTLIDALYEASCAGVEIELLVRGVCCLRPGVPGLSENIRVRSVVGRYLEHSRIFRFGSLARGRRHFIGSADLMTRNLEERVEVATPVEDPELQRRLDEILAVNLDPAARCWVLTPDGSWRASPAEGGFSTQARLQELAEARSSRGSAARRVPLPRPGPAPRRSAPPAP